MLSTARDTTTRPLVRGENKKGGRRVKRRLKKYEAKKGVRPIQYSDDESISPIVVVMERRVQQHGLEADFANCGQTRE